MFEWKKFLTPKPRTESEGPPTDDPERIRVAICAILLEVAEYDEDFSPVEREKIQAILKRRFGLSDLEAAELIETSARKRRESQGLRPFTHFINENYPEAERMKIMEAAWEVVYADETLNSLEDHFVHRLAKLLGLEHSQLIEAKLKVKYGKPGSKSDSDPDGPSGG